MKCQYCRNEANWVDNIEIYGKRYGDSYMMYWCKPCDARVGCHNNTRDALGTLANKKLRMLRQVSKNMFIDKVLKKWDISNKEKNNAYHWLADKMGIDRQETHFGMFNEKQCEGVIEIVKNYENK